MKTPQDFDYDLWTTSNGRFFICVKEICNSVEASVEVIHILQAEEKQLCREITSDVTKETLNAQAALAYEIKHPLFLDAVGERDSDECTFWLRLFVTISFWVKFVTLLYSARAPPNFNSSHPLYHH